MSASRASLSTGESETAPIGADIATQTRMAAGQNLDAGESIVLADAFSDTLVYAASSSCTTSITVYNPYRKYENSRYWATSKVKVSRSSGCASKTYYNFLSFDGGWLKGYGWVSYHKFTVKPGYVTTAWASHSCSTTSSSGNWKAILTGSYNGSPLEASPATSLSCRP